MRTIQSRTHAIVKQAGVRQGLAWMIVLAGFTGCGENSVTDPGTPVPVVGTSHPGFDTSLYPGDAGMTAWLKPASPYEWVGYYLEAPCHKDASWSGKRQKLTEMGWGLAVIYVGQQTWGGTPGKPWEAGERRESVMVFIGRKLPRRLFEEGLAYCVA